MQATSQDVPLKAGLARRAIKLPPLSEPRRGPHLLDDAHLVVRDVARSRAATTSTSRPTSDPASISNQFDMTLEPFRPPAAIGADQDSSRPDAGVYAEATRPEPLASSVESPEYAARASGIHDDTDELPPGDRHVRGGVLRGRLPPAGLGAFTAPESEPDVRLRLLRRRALRRLLRRPLQRGLAGGGAPWQRHQRLWRWRSTAWPSPGSSRTTPGARRGGLLYVLSLLAIAYAALVAVAPQWVFATQSTSLSVSVPWGGAVTYHELDLRPPARLSCSSSSAPVSSPYPSSPPCVNTDPASAPRPGRCWPSWPSAASVVNDAAVATRSYAFVYTLEYAFMGMVVPTAYSFSEHHRRSAELEQGLRDREHRYRSLVEGTEDLVLQIDPGRCIVFANGGAEEAFGVPRGALVGTAFLDLVDPLDQPRLARAMDEWLAGRSVLTSFEARHLTFAEETLEVLWTVTPVIDESRGTPCGLAPSGATSPRANAPKRSSSGAFSASSVNRRPSCVWPPTRTS